MAGVCRRSLVQFFDEHVALNHFIITESLASRFDDVLRGAPDGNVDDLTTRITKLIPEDGIGRGRCKFNFLSKLTVSLLLRGFPCCTHGETGNLSLPQNDARQSS